MKKIIILAVIIAAVLVLFCACSNTLQATIEPAEDPEMIYIELETNPSTGYHWDYSVSDESVIGYVSTVTAEPEEQSGEEMLVGAPVKETWVFEGLKPGDATITMGYYPPAGDQAERTVEYKYTVNEIGVSVLVDVVDSDKAE